MKKLRRWISMLLAFCMLATAMPMWVLAESAASSTPEPEVTPTPEPRVTDTPEPEVTGTPEPEVTGTPEPEVTGTPEPEVTGTPEPEVTGTPESEVTGTPEPEVTGTPEPEVTGTPEPEVTGTPEPEVTGTPEPEVTGTPEPEVTGTPEPEVTGTPEPEVTGTPEPEATGTPEPEVTGTPEPMADGDMLQAPADNGVIENYDELSEDIVYDRPVNNYGTISAGTFNRWVYNRGENAKITGGTFKKSLLNLPGGIVSGAHLDCEIENRDATIRDCTFGSNAYVYSNSGTIELTATVDGQSRKVNFGENILDTLGGDEWYYVSGNQYTPVGSGDTFGLTALTFESRLPSTQTAPQIDVNYREETLTVNLPKDLDAGIDRAQISLHYELDGQDHKVDGAFAQGDSCTIALKDLGLPGSQEKFLRFSLSYGGETGDAAALVVPARPGESNPGTGSGLVLIEYVTEAEIHYIRQGYNVGLSMDPGAGEPDILVGLEEDGLSSDTMEANYHNLEADTEYFVFYRQDATDSSFQSEWYRYDETFKTEPYAQLSVGFNDPIREWGASKHVSEAVIKSSLIFIDEQGLPFDCSANEYTIEVRDAQGEIVELPITEAGDFTVKVTLLPYSYTSKRCQLAKDTTGFSIIRPSEAEVRIDYQKEKITVRRPENLSADSANFSLKFALDGREYTAENVFAGGDSYSIALDTLSMMLGRTLPGEGDAGAADVSIVLYADGAEVQSYTLNVPARPALQKPEGELPYNSIYNTQVAILIPAIYDAGLKLADAEGEKPDIFGDASYRPLEIKYTGLTPGAEYAVCLRNKATPISFSSSWGEVMTITMRATNKWLSLDAKVKQYQWQPDFKLEENTILDSLIFTDQNGREEQNNDYWYDIEVMNDKGKKIALPIREPGVYTVRAIATAWKDHGTDLLKDKDSVEITVLPATPGPHIGYTDEAIFFELPAGLEGAAANISLKFALGDQTYTVSNAFAGGGRCSIALSELSKQLGAALPPSSDAGAVEIAVEVSIGGMAQKPYTLSIPARPTWQDPGMYYNIYTTEMFAQNVGSCDVELRMESDTGSVTIPGSAFNSTTWYFGGLKPSTEYTVCLRNKATDRAFASEWHYDKRTTSGVENLTIGVRKPEYTWTPGFSLSEAEIRENLFSVLTETGEEPGNDLYVIYAYARFEITDGEGESVSLPIQNPGEYTVKFIPDEEDTWRFGFQYDVDTFTISVQTIRTPGVHLDCLNEAITVVLPEELSGSAADVSLKFTLGDAEYIAENAFANGASYAVSLSELGARLGTTLPGEGDAGAADVAIELSIGGIAQQSNTLHIPARPAYSEPANVQYEAQFEALAVFGDLAGYNVRLNPADDPDSEIPASDIYIEDGGFVAVEYHSLPSGTEYTVSLSVKATEDSFRSAWREWKTVSTLEPMKLNVGTSTPKYVWKSGFALNEADIRSTVRLSVAETGEGYDIYDDMYTVEVTGADGQPALPIQEPGVYTVRIIPTEDWPEEGVLAEDSFNITVSIQAEAKVDFANEAVEVSLPKGLNADRMGDITLIFAMDGVRFTYPDAFAGGSTYTVSLSELGELFKKPLPGENGGQGAERLYVMLTSDDVVEETPCMLNIPERPASPGAPQITCEEGYWDIAILNASEYDAGLSPAGEAGDAPAMTGEKQESDIRFANLTADTAYALYLRTAATGSAFCSAWDKQPDEVKTLKPRQLIAGTDIPKYVWKAGESGAPLDETIIRENLRITEKGKPDQRVEVSDEMYTIGVTDANGGPVDLPVNKPGVYTVKITATEAWPEGYLLEQDSFAITVSIQPGADIDFINETLAVYLPEGLDSETAKDIDVSFQVDSDQGTGHCVERLPFKNGSRFDIYLIALGDMMTSMTGPWTLPDDSQDVNLAIWLEGNGVVGEEYSMVIPGRPDSLEIQPYVTPGADYTSISVDQMLEGGEAGLKPADEPGNEPTIFGEWIGGDFNTVIIRGLQPDTAYRLYLRNVATETAFQSLWKDWGMEVRTSTPMFYLQAATDAAEYQWILGFSLDEAAIQKSIVSLDVNDGEQITLSELPAIAVTDEQGAPVELPIRDPGVYTVRAIMSENDMRNGYAYAEGRDTFEITVKALNGGGAFINYEEETITVKLPDELSGKAAQLDLQFRVEGNPVTVNNAFASGNLYTISLSELGERADFPLPLSWEAGEMVPLYVAILEGNSPLESYSLNLMHRNEAPNLKDYTTEPGSRSMIFTMPEGDDYESLSVALKPAGDSGSEPTIFPSSVNAGQYRFTGLEPEAEYTIYACTKTDGYYFRSEWVQVENFITNPLTELRVRSRRTLHGWVAGFSLNEEDIRKELVFAGGDNSAQDVSLADEQYTVSVTDYQNRPVELPIRNPGGYTITVAGTDALPEQYAIVDGSVEIEVYVNASVDIDYIDEELTVSLPEGLDASIADAMQVGIGRPEETPAIVDNFNNGSYTASLSELGEQLGTTLPAEDGTEQTVEILQLSFNGMRQRVSPVVIPARPEFYKDEMWMGDREGSLTSIRFELNGVGDRVSVGLLKVSDAGSEPNIFPSSVSGNVYTFTGLTPNSKYIVYYCDGATEERFRSTWFTDYSFTTLDYTYLQAILATPDYPWTDGFTLDENAIRQNLLFIKQGDIEPVTLTADQYSIAVTDAQGGAVRLPIEQPGQYTVTLAGTDALPEEYRFAQNSVAFTVSVQPNAEIDYAREELTVTIPEGLDSEVMQNLALTFELGGKQHVVNAAFADGSYTVTLSELGAALQSALPNENGAEARMTISLSAINGVQGSHSLKIPARPDAPVMGVNSFNTIPKPTTLRLQVLNGYNNLDVGLRLASAAGSEPTIFPSSVNGNEYLFTGLTPETEYQSYVRFKAADKAFRSAWVELVQVETNAYTYLNAAAGTSAYDWQPGFSLDEAKLRESIKFTADLFGAIVLKDEEYAIAVTDAQSKPVILPIREPGRYTVTVTGTDALQEDFAIVQSSFDITVSIRVSAETDFIKEALTVSLPKWMRDGAEDISLTFELDGKEHTVSNAFENGSCIIALSDLGKALGDVTLPDDLNDVTVNIRLSPFEGREIEPYSHIIPRRPAYYWPGPALPTQAVGYTNITIQGIAAYEAGLRPQSEEGDGPTIFGVRNGANVEFTNLELDTDYVVYLRNMATEKAFCSPWKKQMGVAHTMPPKKLEVSTTTEEYQWTPGFSLDDKTIKRSIVSTQYFHYTNYVIEVTDEQNAAVTTPITQPGVYRVRVGLTEAWADDHYVFDPDTFTITVKPLDLSDGKVSLSLELTEEQKAVYTGEAVYPELGDTGIKITIDGEPAGTLTRDYYTIGAVQGKNNVNAGSAWMSVSAKDGQGSVLGSQEFEYEILPQKAELDVNEALCQTVWTKEFSLSKEALHKVFEVSDAKGRPLSGELYTFSVTREGENVEFPITSAGTYAVEIRLTTGNYTLEENSFEYVVSQQPFAGTVSMNGYVYGETPTQPVLNGYAGDGSVSFWYRAGQDGEWQQWVNITPTSLLPGNYEIRAIAEATVNSAGGETAAAQFSVSPMELGATIEMSDYTYGGEVPVPALVPAIEEVSVEWFYQGADGAEYPWANMTGTTLNAGGYTLIARVTSDVYEDAELRAGFTVRKAKAPAIEWPAAEGITYGQPLSEVKLSAESDEFGTFSWANPEEILNAGEQKAVLNYIPKDTVNYDYTGVERSKAIVVVVEAKDMEGEDGRDFTIEPIPEQTYTGAAIEPKAEVKDGEKQLTEGVDYSVAYANNVDVGTATVTITGMGNYKGTLTVEFVICEKQDEDDDKDDGKDDEEDEKDKDEDAEALTPDVQAEKLSEGEAVDGIVTDRAGAPAPYEAATEEELDEAQSEVIRRTLVITARPLLDDEDQPILKDGEPVYQQRNLHLSRALLNALADKGYTHIRFELKDAALEWMVADMSAEGNVIRLAPMEEDELSKAERKAIGEAETLTDSYRARITAVIDGEEADITDAIPSLTIIFDREHIRMLAEDETAQLLLVPGDGEPEAQLSDALLAEDAETGGARYEAALTEKGLFLMILKEVH